jgi:hypothetical protein
MSYLTRTNNTLCTLIRFVSKVVDGQEVDIAKTFEESRIKIFNDHRLKLFSRLHYVVSIRCLKLLDRELSKMERMQESGATCGHQLYTSMGLPCACHLQGYSDQGYLYLKYIFLPLLHDCILFINYFNPVTPIPPEAVDAHWRKLDFKPAYAQAPEPDYEKKFQDMHQKVMASPNPQVKRSLFQKAYEAFFPGTTKKEPEVRQDPRGRPNLKQQQKKLTARHHKKLCLAPRDTALILHQNKLCLTQRGTAPIPPSPSLRCPKIVLIGQRLLLRRDIQELT